MPFTNSSIPTPNPFKPQTGGIQTPPPNILNFGLKDNRWSYAYFAYGLIRQFLPLAVLEIGLGPQGLGAQAILTAMRENKLLGLKNQKYYCIEKEPTEEAKKVLESFDADLWHCRVGDTNSKETFRLANPHPMEILFVDGEHSSEAVYRDVANTLQVTNFDLENGIVIFHDAQMSDVRMGIKRLKDEFGMTVMPLTWMNIVMGRFDRI